MVICKENGWIISTKNTSYVIGLLVGKPVCFYYGKRLPDDSDIAVLFREVTHAMGTSTTYLPDESKMLTLDVLPLEVSTLGKGDYRTPSVELEFADGHITDFVFESAEVRQAENHPCLPTPRGVSEELVLNLKAEGSSLELHYIVYEETDVIGKYAVLKAEGDLVVRRFASSSLSLPNHSYELVSTYGSWANEGNRAIMALKPGRFAFGSDNGASSNRHNPCFAIREANKGHFGGNAYGFNLVYSGNHEEAAELDTFGNITVQTGISPNGLHRHLKEGDSFASPIAVLTYSDSGLDGVSKHFQSFVRESVVPMSFAHKARPVVYNNWEATMFDFTKAKIESLMKKASDIGAELFVLDDGWFGARDSDKAGLGDWTVNKKKIPGGLESLAKHAKKLGMRFGIWMEPEMVNEDSDLYRAHPDWIIRDARLAPSKSRHEWVLNLTKPEVADFVYEAVAGVLKSAEISYVKWDMNRPFSDIADPNGQSSFIYDYYVSFYKVLGRIVADFPEVLFENCASGGNRFDLGMLSFFAQSWMSDCTDSFQRILIQSGLSLGYPLSVMSNHVAAKVSNQLLRETTLDDKFDVAAFGILGYELDLNDMSPLDEEILKKQIAFYKEHRETFQFGSFTELESFDGGEDASWQAKGENEVFVAQFKRVASIAPRPGRLIARELEEETMYHFAVREQSVPLTKFGHLINMVSPIHLNPEGHLITTLNRRRDMKSEHDEGVVAGSVLLSVGAPLSPEWLGVGYDDHTRLMGDFGARLYHIAPAKEK